MNEVVEFWQYTGKPSEEEIIKRKAWDAENYDHLAIRHECYQCGSKNTMWVRQEWCVCFNCIIAFTVGEALDYQIFLREERDKLQEDSRWKW